MAIQQPRSFFKQAISLLIVVSAFLFIERQINYYLARQAIESNDLDHYSFDQALQLAQSEDKPILANFSALWCGACRSMEKNLLSRAKVQEHLRSDVVYVRLEETKQEHEPIFSEYGITSFPTLILLDSKGKVIDVIGYVLEENELLSRLPRQ